MALGSWSLDPLGWAVDWGWPDLQGGEIQQELRPILRNEVHRVLADIRDLHPAVTGYQDRSGVPQTPFLATPMFDHDHTNGSVGTLSAGTEDPGGLCALLQPPVAPNKRFLWKQWCTGCLDEDASPRLPVRCRYFRWVGRHPRIGAGGVRYAAGVRWVVERPPLEFILCVYGRSASIAEFGVHVGPVRRIQGNSASHSSRRLLGRAALGSVQSERNARRGQDRGDEECRDSGHRIDLSLACSAS